VNERALHWLVYCQVPKEVMRQVRNCKQQTWRPSTRHVPKRRVLNGHCTRKVNEKVLMALIQKLLSHLQHPRWIVWLGGAACCLAASSPALIWSSTGTRGMGIHLRSTPITTMRTNWKSRALSTMEGCPCSLTISLEATHRSVWLG